MKELLTPMDAARLAGVSYPTLKQWIYKGKIHSTKTVGGHHRIARAEIERVIGVGGGRPKRGKPIGLDAISGRNKLLGTVARIRVSGLLAEVTLDVAGQKLTAIITKSAVNDLQLKPGSPAYALIKATEVMVIRAE